MLQNECEFMEVRKLFNKLIKLEDIVKSQSFDHLIQIRFYVFGKDECHIFLLPNTTLNDNRGYHFSKFHISLSHLIDRKIEFNCKQ